ncbi:paraquat-inducible protein A [Shewanella sp. VB17]|uniref:paraquat-inducible protein A n=1 Tax=Shewanella sp. VB17 TaxID=2739432 RepID=UPI001567B341|nr:paraquat-inducible protein A [Shewanella sp. VB17]NRD74026.1 paraquat-inducible protein A [Shewanella sp. VB17]
MGSDCIKDSVTLCHSCDLVVTKRALPSGVRALCPRCNTVLYDTPYCSINGMLALCITALICFTPANFFPILELHFLGSVRTTTIIEGALAVYDEGYWLVGIAVIITAIIAPGILIISILSQILIIKYRLHSPFFRRQLKRLLGYQHFVSQLTMLEIYLISILVTVFNLSDFADIFLGLGTFCFILLFIATLFLQREYNVEHMWSFLDE